MDCTIIKKAGDRINTRSPEKTECEERSSEQKNVMSELTLPRQAATFQNSGLL